MSKTDSLLLLAAGRLLGEITGSCPADTYDWHRPPMDDCHTHCHQGCEAECWVMYAKWLTANAEHEPRAVASRGEADCSAIVKACERTVKFLREIGAATRGESTFPSAEYADAMADDLEYALKSNGFSCAVHPHQRLVIL